MYRTAINDIPYEHWRLGEEDYLIPARLVYHVLEAGEYYSGTTPEGFKWGHRFDADWEGDDANKMPTKEQALGYLNEIQIKVEEWLRKKSDSDMLSLNLAFFVGYKIHLYLDGFG